MRITPLDVRKQEFRRGMRGYDADEVRAFLVTLADEYEAVLVDNKQLRERLLEQDEKLAEYRTLEKTLRDTLMTAERVTQEARETARKQGEVLVAEARQRVAQVLAAGRAQIEAMRREAQALHREKEIFLGRFHSLAEAQIQFVKTHRSDFQDLDARLLDQVPPAAPGAGDAATGEQADPLAPPAGIGDHSDRLRDQWRDYAIEHVQQDPPDGPQDPAVEPDSGPDGPRAAAAPDPGPAPAAVPLPPVWTARTGEQAPVTADEPADVVGDSARS